MKTFIVLIFLITANTYSQLSIEVHGGLNSLMSPGINYKNGIHTGLGLSYQFNEFIKTRGSLYFGQIKNNANTSFQASYTGAKLDIMPSFTRIIGLKDEKWRIFPYIGLGYASYADEEVLTINGGIQSLFRISKRFWLQVEIGRNGNIGQEKTLDGEFEINTKGVDSYMDFAVVGLVFEITKRKIRKKTALQKSKSDLSEIIKEKSVKLDSVPSKVINIHNEFVQPLNEIVLFDEGKATIKQSQLASIIKMVEYMKENLGVTINIVGTACSNHGSDKRNQELSEQRAITVYQKMISLGINDERLSFTGKGNDTTYASTDGDAQKRVYFIINK